MDVIVLLIILAFCKNVTRLNVLTILFELGAVFFLMQSMFNTFSEGSPNWYLPLALLLNCIGIFLNTAALKKKK